MMNHTNLSKLILVIFILMHFVMCKTAKFNGRNQSNVIVYKVFDSLENLLCKRIELLKAKDSTFKDSIFITIEPAGDFRYGSYKDQERSDHYLYNFRIFHRYYYKRDTIFDISNRIIEICGRKYPVFFLRIDDVFRVRDEDRNMPFPDNVFSEALDLYGRSFYRVDLAHKKVVYNSYGDR